VIVAEDLTEMFKGVLEGCIFESINHGETYGYEITRRLKALGFTDIVEGTVYTILVRLEKNKLVDIEKNIQSGTSAKNFRGKEVLMLPENRPPAHPGCWKSF
jgi:DNA-binding PadR family transcriptional regulator